MEHNGVFPLQSGEYLAVSLLEITDIPSISLLSGDYPPSTNADIEFRKDFGALLGEIFQLYRTHHQQSVSCDLSAELLWLSVPIENQPFKASIRLFLVMRAISESQNRTMEILSQFNYLCSSMLKSHRYGIVTLEYHTANDFLSGISGESMRALVKSERIESLPNHLLSSCYSFDLMDGFASDLSNIIDAMTEYPHCAISFQLIPTRLTQIEQGTITQTSQVLGTLSKGIVEYGIGHISVASAENIFKVYQNYQTNQNSPLFAYNILVLGETKAVSDILSKLSGFFSHDLKSNSSLKQEDVSPYLNVFLDEYHAAPWILNEILQQQRDPAIWGQSHQIYSNYYRLPYIITAEEASGFFRLPIGSQRVSAGLKINESESIAKSYGDNLINSGDITVGYLKTAKKDSIGISLRDLARHMLVVGTPGSGKTTFSVGLLDRLWKEHKIPFLIIEPAKTEYRALVQSIPDLQIFTPGKRFISPFVFNPFVPPKNVRLETYKSTLKTAFSAAVSMTTPLDKIFEETINNCYSDFNWLDNYTIADKGNIFNISDFIRCFQETFDNIGYTGDARNIGRAGVVRLNSLVNLFDNYYSIPIQDILEKPTVIELAAIENSDEKALIIALLLLSILAYVNANYIGDGGLRNVILLEEAHVLLDADSNGGSQDANPSAIAQGLIKRMLAEIRSYGVGLIIADQSPRKVTADVVALTDMKVVFRLVEATDKQIIADSMNMEESQVRRLSKLRPGEAFLFFNRLDEPEEIITPDYRLENNIDITLSDDSIRTRSAYWKDKMDCLRPYPECSYIRYCQDSCDVNRRLLSKEVARRIFRKHFHKEQSDLSPVFSVFRTITKITMEELNGEPFSQELLLCVKCHLWRKIRYETKIPIQEIQIKNSLKK